MIMIHDLDDCYLLCSVVSQPLTLHIYTDYTHSICLVLFHTFNSARILATLPNYPKFIALIKHAIKSTRSGGNMEISEGLQFCQVNANFAQISVSLGKFLGEARGETTEHLRIVTQNSIDVEFRMNMKRN